MNDKCAQPDRPIDAIILAAGMGTRMNRSDIPKVLVPVADCAMIDWVISACNTAGVRRNVLIVGHKHELIRDKLSGDDNNIFVHQAEQLGTGHAVQQAESLYADDADADVLVLCGDGPLIRPETLQSLIDVHRSKNADATLATSVIDDPTGYGRIIRDDNGRMSSIIEDKDLADDQRSICEINPSYYCFKVGPLFDTLKQIDNNNAKGEYYLTSVFGVMTAAGRNVEVVDAVPPDDVLSINSQQQLDCVDSILRRRISSEVLK